MTDNYTLSDARRDAMGGRIRAHNNDTDDITTRDAAMGYLLEHGNLRVPASRYGHDSRTCAEVAYALDTIMSAETGEGMTRDTLDAAMSLVVNDHDDVAYTIVNYGISNGINPRDYFDRATIREYRDRGEG